MNNVPWEREKIKAVGLVGPIGKCLSTLMVHLDLVGLWVVILWPSWLTHGPLSYLVLALLLCVYLYYDLTYLMGFILSHIYCMVLLIKPLDHLLYGFVNKTFGPFYFMVLFYNLWTTFLLNHWTIYFYGFSLDHFMIPFSKSTYSRCFI